jgi:hypothetical protein
MQDEHFMQSWNAGHARFSADLDRGFRQLIGGLSPRGARRKAIRNPYGIPAETGPRMPPRAKASLRGLAATLFTIALWATVLMVATPAPGLAAAREAPVATCACVVLLPLA